MQRYSAARAPPRRFGPMQNISTIGLMPSISRGWIGAPADEAMIAAYRNRMLEQPSPHTGRPYARATINDRVRTVCRFYEWAHRRGLVEELPFRLSDVRVFHGGAEGGLLGHLRRGASVVRAHVFTLGGHER